MRSPGVYFAAERDKASDKTIYNGEGHPSRGAWLEFETDKRDILSVRIDRKRKQPATLLVRALGLAESREEIVELLGSDEMVLRTLDRDPATTKEESLIELYKRFRPGEPPTIDSARDAARGPVLQTRSATIWRRSAATRSTRSSASTPTTTRPPSPTRTSSRPWQYIVALHAGEEGVTTDDIDHFGNRRIRTVGELIQNQFRIGLSRMERVVRERMSKQEPDEITPQSLVNIRPPSWRPSRSSSAAASCRSSWTRPTPPPASRTSAACRRWVRAACRASAPASRCATVHTSHYGAHVPHRDA